MQVVEGLKTRIFSGFSGITSFFEKNIKIYKKSVDKWSLLMYNNEADLREKQIFKLSMRQ